MRIVMIGAGRLAWHLAPALKEAGHDVLQVWSRTNESASSLATRLGAEAVTSIEDVSRDGDVYVCAVKDSVLAALLPTLCKGREDAVFLHTAGSVPLSVFEGYATHYGVLYPMQTFSKERELVFREIPCFIEAVDSESEAVVSSLAHSICRNVTWLSSADRRHLHLSAVFACNFVNHCYDLASELLEPHGISFETLLPLIDETARKVHEVRPREAQTGPALRYDEEVIRAQSSMLHGRMKEVYEVMSKSIHERFED